MKLFFFVCISFAMMSKFEMPKGYKKMLRLRKRLEIEKSRLESIDSVIAAKTVEYVHQEVFVAHTILYGGLIKVLKEDVVNSNLKKRGFAFAQIFFLQNFVIKIWQLTLETLFIFYNALEAEIVSVLNSIQIKYQLTPLVTKLTLRNQIEKILTTITGIVARNPTEDRYETGIKLKLVQTFIFYLPSNMRRIDSEPTAFVSDTLNFYKTFISQPQGLNFVPDNIMGFKDSSFQCNDLYLRSLDLSESFEKVKGKLKMLNSTDEVVEYYRNKDPIISEYAVRMFEDINKRIQKQLQAKILRKYSKEAKCESTDLKSSLMFRRARLCKELVDSLETVNSMKNLRYSSIKQSMAFYLMFH